MASAGTLASRRKKTNKVCRQAGNQKKDFFWVPYILGCYIFDNWLTKKKFLYRIPLACQTYNLFDPVLIKNMSYLALNLKLPK